MLPSGITLMLSEFAGKNSASFQWVIYTTGIAPTSLIALLLLIHIGIGLWLLWGTACILLIGERIVKSPAGRNRSSFASVRRQGMHYVIPLFLTSILRDIFTLLWMLLLVIPGIIYKIRTSFYAVIIICEGKEYRAALQRSKELVRGRTWQVLWYFIAAGFLIFFPFMALSGFLVEATRTFDPRTVPTAVMASGALLALSSMLFQLTTVQIYKVLKDLPKS
ncbi:MAG: hypothetical protein PHO92_00365 [Candidatus Peribacteraceae bacterium]|nr:hypothetical protein [Candidatus Peribacteraceae bacterium]